MGDGGGSKDSGWNISDDGHGRIRSIGGCGESDCCNLNSKIVVVLKTGGVVL